MKMLVRFVVSILLNVVMLLAFMQAPSLHVHAHEATERHAASFIHTHLPHVEAPLSDREEWQDLDPDDDAQFLSWVSFRPSYEGLAPLILIASNVILPAPVVGKWHSAVLRPSAHDPPALNATTPRAPPV